MIIELRKVSHQNKGAELMLRALVAHYAGRPEVTLCGRVQVGPRERRAALGIRALLYASNRGWFATTPRAVPPRGLRRRLGLVHPADLDAVLDASGFAYGDQWGPDKARQAASYFRYVRRCGGKVVLMPQSMGPFEKPAVRDAARRLLDQVDLAFPRDATALECVTDLGGADGRVFQAPDFTPLVDGAPPPDLEIPEGAAAIIPNQKMIQMTGARPEAYERLVADVIGGFGDRGLRPFFLRHAKRDEELIGRIQALLPAPIPVVREPDALRIKGVIGRCRVALCSRYHGLVSALSQGVPSIATGWSHKYRHLVEEYGCPEALVDVDADREAVRERVASLLEPSHHAALRARLAERAAWHRDRVRSMWERVDALLG